MELIDTISISRNTFPILLTRINYYTIHYHPQSLRDLYRSLERDWSANRVNRGVATSRLATRSAQFSAAKLADKRARAHGEPIQNVRGARARKLTPNLTKILRHTLGAIRRMTTVVDKEEARKRLTPLQWHVTQEKGTER